MATISERPRVSPSATTDVGAPQIERCANQLLDWVQGLHVPFRFEPSMRISARSVAKNRFLVSIDRSDCTGDLSAQLQQFARAFRLPEIVRSAIDRESIHAGHFHWGFEHHRGQLLYKFYMERAASRAALSPQDPAPILYLAFKWLVSDPNQHVVTHYRWQPCDTLQEIRTRVASCYGQAPTAAQPPSQRAAGALLDLIPDGAESLPLFLEVIEPANSRRSFDINTYDSQLRLRDVTSAIVPLLQAYQIDESLWHQQLLRLGDLPLGHFAAGSQRNGHDFVTLYYGAKQYRHDDAVEAM